MERYCFFPKHRHFFRAAPAPRRPAARETGPQRRYLGSASVVAGIIALFALPSAPNTAMAQGDVQLISAVQGTGLASPLTSTVVTIEGIVVGDFQTGDGADGDINGFFLQEEDSDADGDAASSEGIFVSGVTTAQATVNKGDRVRVTGTVREFSAFSDPGTFTRTELYLVTAVQVLDSGNALPSAAVISAADNLNTLERYEGMAVSFSGSLLVNDTRNLDAFGELDIVVPPGPTTFTEENAPDAAQYQAHILDVVSRIILLDDGRDSLTPDPIIFPDGQLDAVDELRRGDTVSNIAGVLDFAFSRFRIRQTGTNAVFTVQNPRPATPPTVAGSLKVASFNVQNFFVTTRDLGATCGPLNNINCRGADNPAEYDRQLSKLTAALGKLDADIVGLQELENSQGVKPLEALTAALNNEIGAGTYAYVDTGVYGGDVIRQGFIYKPAVVGLIGTHAILDANFVSPAGTYDDLRNRPTLLQTFEEIASGERFSVAVVHFKSKSASAPCDAVGDPDTGDGQGVCNVTRTNGARQVAAWLATDPTGSNDSDYLILGDFNAFAMEDPITGLEAEGYTRETQDYSFVFSGQSGALDHIFASAGFGAFVTGQGSWHINADEPDAFDYNTTVFGNAKPAGLFAASEFRSSDHDPVLIGLYLKAASVGPPSQPVIERVDAEGDAITLFVAFSSTGGAPIDELNAECSGGGMTLTGTGSGTRVNVDGVSPGTTYRCTVSAGNRAGFPSPVSDLSAPILVEEAGSGLPVWLLIEGQREP